MNLLRFLIILAIPIAFIIGIGFAGFTTIPIYNEPNHTVVTQINNMTNSQNIYSNSAIVNQNTNRIYVLNELSNTTSVIDGNSNTKIVDIHVNTYHGKVYVDPNTNRIYVVSFPDYMYKVMKQNMMISTSTTQNGTISVIDGNNYTKIADIRLGASSVGGITVDPNTNRLYVVSSPNYIPGGVTQNSTLSVIDGNNYTKIEDIRLGAIFGDIYINPNTNHLYVMHRYYSIDHKWQNGTISVIDGNNYAKIAEIEVGVQPMQIAINSVTDRIYVTNYGSGTVSVIDGNSNTLIDKPIYLHSGVEGIAVNPITNRIYVMDGFNSTLCVIDGYTNKIVDTISKLNSYNVSVNPNTNRIYVPSPIFNNLSIIDGRDDNIMSVIQIGKYP